LGCDTVCSDVSYRNATLRGVMKFVSITGYLKPKFEMVKLRSNT